MRTAPNRPASVATIGSIVGVESEQFGTRPVFASGPDTVSGQAHHYAVVGGGRLLVVIQRSAATTAHEQSATAHTANASHRQSPSSSPETARPTVLSVGTTAGSSALVVQQSPQVVVA